jgi:hypothetical protein
MVIPAPAIFCWLSTMLGSATGRTHAVGSE